MHANLAIRRFRFVFSIAYAAMHDCYDDEAMRDFFSIA